MRTMSWKQFTAKIQLKINQANINIIVAWWTAQHTQTQKNVTSAICILSDLVD